MTTDFTPERPAQRSVGFWFALFIVLLPMPVALFTLQRGYSGLVRVLALGWLGTAAALTAHAIPVG